jgi:hypothetical protein
MSPNTISGSRKHQTLKSQQSLIICLDQDKAAIENVKLAYKSLLIHFPQWSSRSALVFFVAPIDDISSVRSDNVYFYPNIDKEPRDALVASAAVKIALDTSHQLDNNNAVPTLISTDVQHINQVKVNSSDHVGIAKALNNVLVSNYTGRQAKIFDSVLFQNHREKEIFQVSPFPFLILTVSFFFFV